MIRGKCRNATGAEKFPVTRALIRSGLDFSKASSPQSRFQLSDVIGSEPVLREALRFEKGFASVGDRELSVWL